ncbi:MAG: elongation factor P [Rickettsiaceae bacterium H1]|nr:elongation factor P [Rickettsiaceae bacterium H1]
MKIIANEIRVGNILEHKNGLWEVLKVVHTKPGKGGAYIQVEMKEIIKNTKLNERFRSSENVEKAVLDEEEYQYLYSDGEFITLMNQSTYEQFSVKKSLLGEKLAYLSDGIVVKALSHNEQIIRIKFPKHMVFVVAETEVSIKGQTATASYKPAKLENGLSIMVPPFISVGDKVVVNTEDDSYVEREK